jgi:hypothetical protein
MVSICVCPYVRCHEPLVSVGRHVADAALWIAITSFLATFSVRKALDEHGKEIPVVPKFTTGITMFVNLLYSIPSSGLSINYFSHPETFPCRIFPRYDASVENLTQLIGLGVSSTSPEESQTNADTIAEQ